MAPAHCARNGPAQSPGGDAGVSCVTGAGVARPDQSSGQPATLGTLRASASVTTVSPACGEPALRHHGVTRSTCAGSTGSPRRGMTSCTPRAGALASSVSAGSSQACMARLKVPQCTGRRAPPPSSAWASSALSGPRWMSPQEGWKAPTSSITRSKGPSRSRMRPYSVVRPVSPMKKTECLAVRIMVSK